MVPSIGGIPIRIGVIFYEVHEIQIPLNQRVREVLRHYYKKFSSGVSVSLLLFRKNRFTPNSSSRALIALEIEGCVTKSSFAAFVML